MTGYQNFQNIVLKKEREKDETIKYTLIQYFTMCHQQQIKKWLHIYIYIYDKIILLFKRGMYSTLEKLYNECST